VDYWIGDDDDDDDSVRTFALSNTCPGHLPPKNYRISIFCASEVTTLWRYTNLLIIIIIIIIIITIAGIGPPNPGYG